jgi:hypothetical protein
LSLTPPSGVPSRTLNRKLTLHGMINGNACFTYLGKNRGTPALALASAFLQATFVGAQFGCSRSIVGDIGCKGQPRNIHSLGDDASLAMAHGHVAQCAIEMLAPHLLIHQEWRHRHDFSEYAQLNKDASGHSKTQHDGDIAFVIALPVRHPPVLRDRSAVRSVTQRAQEILPDRLTLSGL